MTRQPPLFLLLLLAYIVAPALYNWASDSAGVWYKPFLLWALVIVFAAWVVGSKPPQ